MAFRRLPGDRLQVAAACLQRVDPDEKPALIGLRNPPPIDRKAPGPKVPAPWPFPRSRAPARRSLSRRRGVPGSSSRAGIWVAVTAALLAPSLAGGAALTETAQPAVFASSCAPCHGESAQGTDRAPSLMANRMLQGLSAGAIAAIITHGRGGVMPAFSDLPATEIAALAGYVRSLNTNAFETGPPGDVAEGRRIFFGSGRCAGCHTAEGRGGIDGPDLSSIGRL
ncbi:MAG: c-type cytochrome, partial [Bradyrhizobium sp.]